MTRRIRRKSEVVRFMNERNFPHLVELVLPPEGTVNDKSRSAVAGIDTRPSHSTSDCASQTLPLRMHSAIASVARA
jgi:hypothetical protein